MINLYRDLTNTDNAPMRKEFCYVFSTELDVPIRVRLVSLFGFLPNNNWKQRLYTPSGCICVKLTVYCNGRIVGWDVQSSFKQCPSSANKANANREIQKWDEWLALPVTYADLCRDATLHITVWDVENTISPVLIAHCSKPLFSKYGIFRSGLIDLRLERAESDEGHANSDVAPKDSLKSTNGNRQESMTRDLIKREKMYKLKFIERVDWLDRITFSRLEEIKQEARVEDRSLYLTVEMPTVCHLEDSSVYSIVFYAEDAECSQHIALSASNVDIQPGFDYSPPSRTEPSLGFDFGKTCDSRSAFDCELGLENLCELKHHMLTRNARANDIDRRLQPNPSARDALEAIIRAPSSLSMTTEERDLIWKFRFWLRSNPRALTKFVRSVNWQESLEVQQAVQVIKDWARIEASDALELLAPQFTHPFIRRYAVSRLQCTTCANILLYLPQLVQALRYEQPNNEIFLGQELSEGDMFIVESPATAKKLESTIRDNLSGEGSQTQSTVSALTSPTTLSIVNDYSGEKDLDLCSFLILCACKNSVIANFLYWYLKVEVEANANIEEQSVSQMYSGVIAKLKKALANGSNSARQTLTSLGAQKKFVDTLVEMAKLTAEVSGSRAKKLEILKKKLSENQDLLDLKGLSLPLDPSIHVKSIHVTSTQLFSSNLMPMRLTFSTVRGSVTPYECGEAYTTIFKRGDDLRQDQLVLQMIRLMDNLMKEDKLDLCLTPYAVLATSCSEGFVQFIKATPLADLKSIQDTLRTFRPSSSGPYGIEAEVLNNYVKSCAGYSIICYILGVGDRHLHNLLLSENGRMFHVDYGFILGRDPKPMPPAMKLTSEMVNAMGGQNSEHFKSFVNYCATAFCILRRHANLITNLFTLMLDAGIPDIAVEKDKAVMKVLEKFHLNLSDEEACQQIVRLIESSIAAKMPILVDFVHNVKQFISN